MRNRVYFTHACDRAVSAARRHPLRFERRKTAARDESRTLVERGRVAHGLSGRRVCADVACSGVWA